MPTYGNMIVMKEHICFILRGKGSDGVGQHMEICSNEKYSVAAMPTLLMDLYYHTSLIICTITLYHA